MSSPREHDAGTARGEGWRPARLLHRDVIRSKSPFASTAGHQYQRAAGGADVGNVTLSHGATIGCTSLVARSASTNSKGLDLGSRAGRCILNGIVACSDHGRRRFRSAAWLLERSRKASSSRSSGAPDCRSRSRVAAIALLESVLGARHLSSALVPHKSCTSIESVPAGDNQN
jgi:hypothetical protein